MSVLQYNKRLKFKVCSCGTFKTWRKARRPKTHYGFYLSSKKPYHPIVHNKVALEIIHLFFKGKLISKATADCWTKKLVIEYLNKENDRDYFERRILEKARFEMLLWELIKIPVPRGLFKALDKIGKASSHNLNLASPLI